MGASGLLERIEETCAAVRERVPEPPEVALVLGSGLGPLAERIQDPVRIPYEDLPHFPRVTVHGHAGQLVCGTLGGRRVMALKGRFHVYEGWSAADCVYPVRMLRKLGADRLVVSNAAGGVNRWYQVGDLCVLDDIVNWQFLNPLVGPNEEALGPRFPDMSAPFSPRLQELATVAARELKVRHQRGVYFAMTGPSYETRAELRMLAQMGADAVGMSTVPEVTAGVHCGYDEILGISCITNIATGESVEKPNHEEVLEATRTAEAGFCDVVTRVLERLES